MKWSIIIASVLSLGIGIGGGFLLGRRDAAEQGKSHAATAATIDLEGGKKDQKKSGDEKEAAEKKESDDNAAVAPVCLVQISPIQHGDLEMPVTALGTVIIAPSGQRVINAPYDSTVTSIITNEGAAVTSGAVIITLAPSAEILAQQQEALLMRAASERELTLVQQRLALHLATAADTAQAEAVAELARLKVSTWEVRLANKHILANESGVLSHLMVRPGQTLLLGAPIAEITTPGHTMARIGIDPAERALLTAGTIITLKPLRRHGAESTVTATVTSVATQLTAENQLLEVLVNLPQETDLVVGESVRADIPRTLRNTLIIPRQALVRDDSGWAVFTVSKDTAQRHSVTLVAEDHDRAAITGTDMSEKLSLIVLGHSVVTDGMRVRIVSGSAP